MLDYGWKRMKHPDASLQGFRGTVFYTDEVDNHEIQLPLGGVLSVYPYGRKGRDPKYQSANCSSVITGSIAWGLGQGTTSLSAAQMNTGPFTHAYNVYGAKTVTLTVNASACTTANCPCGGTASSSTATIYIRVPKYEDCAPDCPEPDEFVTTLSPTDETKEKPAGPDLSSAIRTIQPNPFGSAVAIHFTVPKATKPVMEVFDITGRRVTHAALPEYAAGAWTWTWNGMDESGHRANAGIYFIRARLGPTTEIRRLVKLDQ
jgi:hypothetical protein